MAKKERLTSPAETAPANEIQMKDKKKKKSKKSSQAKLLLLQSIVAYLETNGFTSTLTALRSEARLENTDYKATAMNLEDIFAKCLDSREADEEMNHGAREGKSCVDLAEVKASDMPLDDSHMAPKEKKKKQQLASVGTSDRKINKSVLESFGDDGKNLHLEVPGAIVQNVDKCKKKKKHKKNPDHSDGVSEGNDLGEFREMVKGKVEELKSLVHKCTNVKDDLTTKQKDEKKKKRKEASDVCENTENPKNNSDGTSEKLDLNSNADTQSLDKMDVKHKGKRKKNKSTSGDIDTMVQTAADAIDVRDSVEEENEKTVSKKRKRSHTEESQQVMEANGSSDLKLGAAKDNNISSTLQKDGMPLLADEPQLLTKKRKTEKKENGSMQNGNPNSNSSRDDSKNEKANGHVNEKLNPNKVDGGALSTKKEKCSIEPKTAHAFQRVKVDEVEFVDERLQDNSYWAKDGADNGYGAKAQEILGQVRGRDFRHEKTKKKRGSYRGGQVDLHSHSIKFNYSDEE